MRMTPPMMKSRPTVGPKMRDKLKATSDDCSAEVWSKSMMSSNMPEKMRPSARESLVTIFQTPK